MMKAGAFATPSATGALAVTGLGFVPTWVVLVAVNATEDDIWQTGNSCISFGLMGSNGGSIFGACNRRQWDSTTNASSSYETGVAIEVGSARGAMGTNVIYRALPVSLDADGFTLDFAVAAAGYRVYYLAGANPAAAGARHNAGLLGLDVGQPPNALVHLGLSDALAGANPVTWDGGAFTALFGVGRTGPSTADNRTVAWSPGVDAIEKYNELDYPGWGSHWGPADELFAFGAVIQGAIVGRSNGNDLEVTNRGAGDGTYVSAIGMRADADAADFSAAAAAGGSVTKAYAFVPSVALTLGGNTQGRLVKDPDHMGASVGAVDSAGNMWVVACGTKMGTGAARYQSLSRAWISGWEPYNAPTAITAGTAAITDAGVTYTTIENAEAHVLLRHAVLGGGGFLPQIYRVVRT